MYRIAFALAGAALTGCAAQVAAPPAQPAPEPTEQVSPIKLDKTDIAAIQAGVRRALKDPDSARFGQMLAGNNSKNEISVCLMVNAKNSYGGYTGEKPYLGLLFRDKKPPVFAVVPDDGRFPEHRDAAIFKLCGNRGLPLMG
jgi:hypothetical protein